LRTAGDKITVRQSKTGTPLMIPIGAELRAAIAFAPADHLTFLTTAQGKPFTAAGFTNWFRRMCNDAGLGKGLSAHGLRKAMCRRLAEAGCSEKQIAPSPDIRRCAWCSTIPPPPTRSAWRPPRSASSPGARREGEQNAHIVAILPCPLYAIPLRGAPAVAGSWHLSV
jgi:Phage integrase family